MTLGENGEIRYLKNPEELARIAAIELHGLLKRRTSADSFGIALSGGRIAKSFYTELVHACSRAPVDWTEVHFFWADERCVPPLDPESNFSTARAFLFDPLNIPTEQIHRIYGDVDPEYSASQAEAEICRILPINDQGQPVLNLAILGMGEDGHIASLFPGEAEALVKDSRVYRHVTAVKPPPKRITLGYAPIFAAKEVWILASGPGKKQAFEQLLHQDESLPVTRIVKESNRALIFQDIAPL